MTSVSVVIPSYNHAPYIGQAIDSVAQQDIENLEVIVVDDGSKDQSLSMIESALTEAMAVNRHLRTSFIRQENRGAHHAINLGLAKARGDWLTILNSDDFYMKDRLKRLARAAKNQASDMVFTRVKHIDENGDQLRGRPEFLGWYEASLKMKLPTVGFHLLFNNVAISSGNLFFHRRLWERLEGFREHQLMHDYDFILRALTWTEPVWVRDPLLAYRVHSDNTSSTVQHRAIYEAPQLATDFLLQTALYPNPKNRQAPWGPRWRKIFLKFMQECDESWVRGWIGYEHMDSCLRHLARAEDRL